jgi:hypothetical protein
MLVGGTGSAAEELASAGAPLAAGAAEDEATTAGAHGGGGHAVTAGGASSGVAEADEDAMLDKPEGFSGAMIGGSPSQATREASGTTPAKTTRVRMLLNARMEGLR